VDHDDALHSIDGSILELWALLLSPASAINFKSCQCRRPMEGTSETAVRILE
jgi:hypothetical protein